MNGKIKTFGKSNTSRTESFMKFAVGQSFYTHLSIVDARFRKHHHKK